MLGVEQPAVAVQVERHRHIVVADRRRNEYVGTPGPGAAVRRHRQVHLERDGAVGVARDIARGPSGAPRHRREGDPAVAREKALERELVLAVRRAGELGVHARTERGVGERQGEPARQLLGGSGVSGGSGTGRSGVRARRGAGRRSRSRCAIGTGEPAHEQREGRGHGQA